MYESKYVWILVNFLFRKEYVQIQKAKGIQGSHRLEKYFNIQDSLEKSLKMKFALKSTCKTLKGLEKPLDFTICKRIQHCFLEA